MIQLLDLGADPSWTNNKGTNVMQLVAKSKSLKFARHFERTVGLEKMTELVRNSNNIGWTPLHAAAEAEAEDMVEWLIGHGADVCAQTVTDWTPGKQHYIVKPMDSTRPRPANIAAKIRKQLGRCMVGDVFFAYFK